MWHTPPSRKLMEDRTSWNPDELPLIFRALQDRDVLIFIMSKVVVSFLHGFGVIGFIILRGDGVWAFGAGGSWDRDLAFFTRGDEMAKVSSVCTVEPVFQSLTKRRVSKR